MLVSGRVTWVPILKLVNPDQIVGTRSFQRFFENQARYETNVSFSVAVSCCSRLFTVVFGGWFPNLKRFPKRNLQPAMVQEQLG